MDTRSGDIYPTKEAALVAGVPEDSLITGSMNYLRRMKKLFMQGKTVHVKQKANKNKVRRHKRERMRMQKESRKANR